MSGCRDGKPSTGLVIFINVEEIVNPVLIDTDIEISDRVYLRMHNEIRLDKEVARRFISKGIESLREEINAKLQGSIVCFDVKSIDFNMTDFQVEGLHCAIREWIAKYYEIKIEPIKIDYDKISNKNIFEIPGL